MSDSCDDATTDRIPRSDAAQGTDALADHRVAPHRTHNIVGLIGLTMALAGGLLTCGLLSPVGLLVSLFGLGKPPRGWALAGTIIGVIGTLWLVVFGFALLIAALGLSTAQEAIAEKKPLWDAAREVHEYRRVHGSFPDNETGQSVVSSYVDANGQHLPYEMGNDDFSIRGSGPDGVFGTSDDVEHRGYLSSGGSDSFEIDD